MGWGTSDNIESRKYVDAASHKRKRSLAKLAEEVGISNQSLCQKLVNNTLRSTELEYLMDMYGYEMQFVDKKTGEKLSLEQYGHGRHVKAVINYYFFDNRDAEYMGGTFYEDGINEWTDDKAQEVFLTYDGKWFMVNYSNKITEKDSVMEIPESIAFTFLAKYGKPDAKERYADKINQVK